MAYKPDEKYISYKHSHYRGKILICLLFIMSIFLCLDDVLSCTSFYLEHDKRPVHGANLDWYDGQGIIVANKRGFLKVAISDPEKSLNPARWTNRYGSVTFNLYGYDWTWGGMNEAGLSCSSMLLSETKYSKADSRPSIFAGQWLQYQLDNSASISDVLASITKVRIRQTNQ